MIEPEDLAVLYGRMRAGYDVLQPLQQKLNRVISGDLRVYECNSEEKRIAKLLDEGLWKIAEALDDLSAYTWNTYVTEHSGRVAEDAVYLAQEETRKEFGNPLEVICVERVPTEYASQILWRITMRLPRGDDDEE